MLAVSEIAEEYEAEDGLMVSTPCGYRKVSRVYKTVPLPVWRLETESYVIECSAHHLVHAEMRWCEVRSLVPGMLVLTETGIEHVVSVSDTGRVEELYDITVVNEDGDSELSRGAFYSGGVVSHNSTTLAARLIMAMLLIPRYKALYVAPYVQQAITFADRFLDMESYCRVQLGTQNKRSKAYPNGSSLRIEHALTSSQKLRGMSLDCICLDECQNMDPDILPEILYCQTNSNIPTTLYAGTALTIDSLLEEKWQNSSMATWWVKDGTGKYINMYDVDTLVAVCDSPDGPRCPKTRKLLNVLDGHYVHSNRQALSVGNIGYHIPSCVVPDVAYNLSKWIKLYEHIKHDPLAKVMQECFGIATAEGTREITKQDLMGICVINDTVEQLQEKCKTGYYKMVISGCDWGGSDYNPATKSKLSYTVHCIIGVAPDDNVDILHYRRYSGMDYSDIISNIVAEHRAFYGKVVSSDFGVGMAYNMELRKYIPFDHHFVMCYTGPQTAPLAVPKNSHMANQLSLNKTEAITNVFSAVKDPLGKIRCRRWEDMGDYLQDWLNVYRELSTTNAGNKAFVYHRAATKSDDALHAFTFAYTLALHFLGVPLVQDVALDTKLRQAMSMRSATSDIDSLLLNGDFVTSL